MNKNINSVKNYPWLLVFAFCIIPYVILFLQSPIQRENFTKEDGIIEYLSAFFYFLASCIYLYLFFKSFSEDNIYIFKTRRNYFLLIIGIVFLFCFGEEISWGQRIFDITPSAWFNDNNLQDETNLHNLKYFSTIDKDNIGQIQIGFRQWITPEGILIIFWLCYCLLIPTINALFSKAHNFFKRNYFPIIAIWIGVLFFINQSIYAIMKGIKLFPVHPIAEIKETNTAFLFLITSISLYIDYFYTHSFANKK